jgi:sugar O-acyltransferase (sialic acid O-acetyltransferase NeuD family)
MERSSMSQMLCELLILGTGPHAIEMTEIVERVNRHHPRWELIGLVSPHGDAIGEARGASRVVGGPEALDDRRAAKVVPEYGWPAEMLPPRERLSSLIDPTAFVSRTATVGVGCVIYPNCFVGSNVRIGDHVFCLSGSAVNHDVVLDDRVTLATNASLAGEVRVERGCYLGQGCLVRQQLRIGCESYIGMGAVVIEDVAPRSVMVGNPARLLRSVDPG